MSAERISAKKVRDLLNIRISVCADAVEMYESQGQADMAATERCAARELEYVRDRLFPLQGGDVRGGGEDKGSIPGSVESSLRCAPDRPLSDGGEA